MVLVWWGWDCGYICGSLRLFNIDKLWHLLLLQSVVHSIQSVNHTHIHRHAHTDPPPTNPASCMCPPPLSPSCICCSPVLYFPHDDKLNLHIFFSGSAHYNALTGPLPASWAGYSILPWHLLMQNETQAGSITGRHVAWVWAVIGIWNQFTLPILNSRIRINSVSHFPLFLCKQQGRSIFLDTNAYRNN